LELLGAIGTTYQNLMGATFRWVSGPLWLSKGLGLEQNDPDFKRRPDQLDARISADR